MTTFIARTDSNTANNAAVNLTGAPAVTLTFSKLGPTGNLLIENGPGGGGTSTLWDPNTTVSVNGGAQLRFDLQFVGLLPTTNNNGANQVPTEYQGDQVILITVFGFPTPTTSTRYMFLQDQSGVTLAKMNAFGNGAISIQQVNSNPPNPPFVCFLAGMQIATAAGPRPVEALEIGDDVLLADGGYSPVTWVSSTLQSWGEDADPATKPIVFTAGCLGAQVPAADLMVSPQHHILIAHPACVAMFGEAEVLAPAKGLLALPGVRVMKGKTAAEYYHIMLGQHQIIMAQGVATESFYPGPTAVRMLSRAQRASLYAVVPALKDDPENGYGPTARKKITRRQAEELVQAMLAARKSKAIAAE